MQAAVRGATSLSCSLGVASCKVVAKVASDRRKPGGLTVVPRRPRGRVPRAVRRAQAPRRRPEGRAAPARAPASTRSAQLAGLDDDRRSAACCRARSGACCTTVRRGSTHAGSSTQSSACRSAPRRRSTATSMTGPCSTGSCGAWPAGSPSAYRAQGEAARTVATKVRYQDFTIRSRSTTLPAGIDDAETLGDVACRLLDRALRDRPGPAAARRHHDLEHRAVSPTGPRLTLC